MKAQDLPSRFRTKRFGVFCVVLPFVTLLPEAAAQAQDLLDDVYTTSTTRLEIIRYATIPNTGGVTDNIISMTTRPDDNSLYVSTQDGRIHRVTPNSGSSGSVQQWFDVNTDVPVNLGSSIHGGLRAIAFHPDFDKPTASGYGKFYGSVVSTGSGSAGFLGSSTGSVMSVVGEWAFDHATGQVAEDSYRELFRVRNPQFDHPIKQIAFDSFAAPNDPDYGLLYIAHGDGSVLGARDGTGQITNDALGKILRIDPLDPDGAGPLRYSTPGNEFADDGLTSTLAEVFSYGHRNPHTLTFAQNSSGETHLITAEVGGDNVDEINLATNGANYGWSDRAGTFVFDNQGARGYANATSDLPFNDAVNDYVYPAAQIDHDNPGTPKGPRRLAIAGGYVGNNGGEAGLQGRFLFGDFAAKSSGSFESSGGQIWSVDFDQLTSAKTTLEIGESPSLLETIDDFSIHELAFDHDNNPDTPAQIHKDFVSLLAADGTGRPSSGRADFRFSSGLAGELYISSKQNGAVYLVTNTLPDVLPGDADGDGDVDLVENLLNDPDGDGISDYDLILANFFNSVANGTEGDLTFDGKVDIADFSSWKAAFGAASSSLTLVPEPTSLLLSTLALACSAAAAPLRSKGLSR